jgi:hypothetical protein
MSGRRRVHVAPDRCSLMTNRSHIAVATFDGRVLSWAVRTLGRCRIGDCQAVSQPVPTHRTYHDTDSQPSRVVLSCPLDNSWSFPSVEVQDDTLINLAHLHELNADCLDVPIVCHEFCICDAVTNALALCDDVVVIRLPAAVMPDDETVCARPRPIARRVMIRCVARKKSELLRVSVLRRPVLATIRTQRARRQR